MSELLREVRDRCRENMTDEEQTKVFEVTEKIRRDLSMADKVHFEPTLAFREWNGPLPRDDKKIALLRKKTELEEQLRGLRTMCYDLEAQIRRIDENVEEIRKQEHEEELQKQEVARIKTLNKRKLRKWCKLRPEDARKYNLWETHKNYEKDRYEWDGNVKAYLVFETERIRAIIKAYEKDINKRVENKHGWSELQRVGRIWRVDVTIMNHPDAKVQHFKPLKAYEREIAQVSGKNCQTIKEMKTWIEKKKIEVVRAITALEQGL